jgi:hypothetical protein
MNESELGTPMNIRQVAAMLGVSAWSVRQSLIPKGLPHLRSGPRGKLLFYQHQVEQWVLRQQTKGGSQGTNALQTRR